MKTTKTVVQKSEMKEVKKAKKMPKPVTKYDLNWGKH